ncbi:MAG: YdcF family protein [Oscillospiraceae bacterium]|nr:YdcF family protein [Oscillospiraceae bacterium]
MTKAKLIWRIVAILFCLGCFLLALVFALNTRIVQKTDSMISDAANAGSGYDCILILGAGVRDDGTPSLMLRDRLEMGIELYKAGASEKIIVSGDHGTEGYDEVNVMKNYLIDAGIPSEDIFMDHAGFSTYESVYRARDIFCVQSMVIVTQEYHLYRALYIAADFELDAVGVPAADIRYYGQTYRDAREILARAKDWVYTVTRPKPTYLGEQIPVWGDGNATNDN